MTTGRGLRKRPTLPDSECELRLPANLLVELQSYPPLFHGAAIAHPLHYVRKAAARAHWGLNALDSVTTPARGKGSLRLLVGSVYFLPRKIPSASKWLVQPQPFSLAQK